MYGRRRGSRLRTKELGKVAFEGYGDEVGDERGEKSHSGQMYELFGEHVRLRVVGKHSDHLGIWRREEKWWESISSHPDLGCHVAD